MANIDNLSIKISADASSASASLDNLCKKLNNLSNAVSGVNASGMTSLSNSLSQFGNTVKSLNGFKASDLNEIIKGLKHLSKVNGTNLAILGSSIKTIGKSMGNLGNVGESGEQLVTLAKALSKFGNTNVSKAITNMPLLASALKDMMNTLKDVPSVSQNLIQMTNALGNLSGNIGKIGSSSNQFNYHMGRVGTSSRNAKKHITSLAYAFGKFYANCFLIIRGVKGLWKSIESSMDYYEVANYFSAAMEQISSNSVNQWQKLGYESAQAYADSFTSVMQNVQDKMTGYIANVDGTISKTGNKSLGINHTTLTNYETTFGQMTSSMGVTSEQAVKLAQALTEIGADLASVKNLDFEEVWGNMASGLVGMSRTLDKYGVNIRNVNLQQKLTDLGIQANIQSLNQSDKALLRTIILLDSTRYAWGDLADTLDETEYCFNWCVA